jgi:hypothetical protein
LRERRREREIAKGRRMFDEAVLRIREELSLSMKIAEAWRNAKLGDG